MDGTRIKAVNNKGRNFTKNSLAKFIKGVDERLDEYLKRLDEDDATESGTGGSRTKNLADKIEALRAKRDGYNAMLNDLERRGEDQISLIFLICLISSSTGMRRILRLHWFFQTFI